MIAQNDIASAFIRNKPALTKAAFNKLLPELKAYFFTVAGIENMKVLQDIRDELSTIPKGALWEDVKAGVLAKINPYFVDPAADAETQAAQQRAANRRAELLVRTHTSMAYAQVAYEAADQERELFPFWQYVTLGDGRARPSHAALDGVVLPHDHPFWKTHTPPWDWGCRCQFIPLSDDDVDELRAQDAALPPEKQQVLDKAALKKLETENTIYRTSNLEEGTGHPVPYNVQSPAESGKPGAFTWQPGTMRPDVASLQKSYPDAFPAFETWARAKKLPGAKQTVWEWIGGKPVATSAEWPELSELKKLKKLGGSTGAELWESPDGRKFVLKRGASAEHLREEATADALYRALGVPVPPHTLLETPAGPVKLAQFIEGTPLTPATLAKHRDAIAKHFAADALMGNWDVAGMNLDNIIIAKDGTPYRIDNGGSLRFRAQGAKKTADEWNDFPNELWTLRDGAKNPVTASVFGKLSIYDIAEQVNALDPAALAAAPAELRAVLESRLGNLRDVARKSLEMQADQWKAEYTDDLTRHMIGLRADAVSANLPKLLTGTPGDVIMRDENGEAFDHLRTLHKHATKKTANDTFFDAIKPAAMTINGHHVKGDTNYNQTKLAAAKAQKPALEALLQNGTAQEKKLAQHYLDSLAAIEAAQGDKKKAVPHITQAALPAGASTATPASRVAMLADYMKKIGGDWKHVEQWAGAQAGSSQSVEATAYKHFLSESLEGAKPEDFFRQPSKAAFDKHVPQAEQAAYRNSLIAHHAFIQELLAATSFEGNDTNRRRIRILRTETAAKTVPFAKGKKGQYKRGVNESGSLVRPIFTGTRTVTNVPHSRITSLYFLERTPGTGSTFLYGDSENEATYMAWGLDAYNGGKDYINASPGTDSTKWEL